ncbi:hypothetical protein SteCoe_17569 [Stentor coeruleus]|uniref:Uncharacterized protein n=1 Tax=Stentor coeruleus TaxID=5963 RepID=A0A1R2BYJ8_9CILI|nr:hypothetical protein SteCoe_17569 [Stentor coeruleus]
MQNVSKALLVIPNNLNSSNIYELPFSSGPKYFLISNGQFHILQQVFLPGSILINNYLAGNPRFYIITPFDNLFLLLGALCANQNRFCDIDDIISESGLLSIEGLSSKFFGLKKICQLTCHENKDFVKLDREKLMDWLKVKYQNLAKEAGTRVAWAIKTYDEGENAKKLALGLLLEYVHKDIILEIDLKYTLDSILSVGKMENKRRYFSQGENEKKKDVVSSKKPKTEKKKEPTKLQRGQKTISSFFTKK